MRIAVPSTMTTTSWSPAADPIYPPSTRGGNRPPLLCRCSHDEPKRPAQHRRSMSGAVATIIIVAIIIQMPPLLASRRDNDDVKTNRYRRPVRRYSTISLCRHHRHHPSTPAHHPALAHHSHTAAAWRERGGREREEREGDRGGEHHASRGGPFRRGAA